MYIYRVSGVWQFLMAALLLVFAVFMIAGVPDALRQDSLEAAFGCLTVAAGAGFLCYRAFINGCLIAAGWWRVHFGRNP